MSWLPKVDRENIRLASSRGNRSAPHGLANNTAIEWLEVKLEGKKRMAVRDFAQGYKPEHGDRMG
jgi:hypothetical protein